MTQLVLPSGFDGFDVGAVVMTVAVGLSSDDGLLRERERERGKGKGHEVAIFRGLGWCRWWIKTAVVRCGGTW